MVFSEMCPKLICPECKTPLNFKGADRMQCCNNHEYFRNGDVLDLLPKTLNKTTEADGRYHDSMKDEWVDLNQLNTVRNSYYHNEIYAKLASQDGEISIILEIGGGNGFDLQGFLKSNHPFKSYTFSEVSVELAQYAANANKDNPKLFFCTADAADLPFASSQFDAVVIIAALHHFPDAERAITEISRVLKPGGILVCGIEPNRRLAGFLKSLVHFARPVMPKKSHSPADEDAEGFVISDFEFFSKKTGMELLAVKPVWFLAGFFHYGLEFLYRVFKLDYRIVIAPNVERMIVAFDEMIGRARIFNNWSWNYTVIYKNIR